MHFEQGKVAQGSTSTLITANVTSAVYGMLLSKEAASDHCSLKISNFMKTETKMSFLAV